MKTNNSIQENGLMAHMVAESAKMHKPFLSLCASRDKEESGERVNFAGIPLNMLSEEDAKFEVHHEYDIVMKTLRTRKVKLVCDCYGLYNEDEEAGINRVLLRDEDVIAFVCRSYVINKATGEKESVRFNPTPYIRIGKNKWTNFDPITGEKDEPFTINRYEW